MILSLIGFIILPTTAIINDEITDEKSNQEISFKTLELVNNLDKYNLLKQDRNTVLDVLRNRKTIESAIIKKEKELLQKPLRINDKRKSLLLKEEFSLNAKDPNSQIPRGGIIQYSSDGVTRIFSSEGVQILDVRDRDVQNVLTPSGKIMPVTHIIAVPENVIVYNMGIRDYYLQDGKILFIKDFGNSNEIALTEKDQLSAGSVSPSWVAWAESDPITDPVILTSQWVVPYSPDSPTNILFNGIEPYDETYISQPVVAFNYPEHNHDGVQWANHWTGASWLCNEPITCDHSRPVVNVNQGDTINGGVIRIPLSGAIPDLWIITTSDVTSGRSTTYFKFFEPKSPSKIVTTYEMYGGQLDRLKISDAIFTNIIARDAAFRSIPITMRAKYNIIDKPHLTGLYVDTFQSPSKITIFTDYAFSIITTTDGNGEIKPSNGAVDPSSRYPIKSNEVKEFTINAKQEYSIDNILVDGQSKGPISSYSFKLINPEDMKDHTISATFKSVQSTFTIRSKAGLGGSINPLGAATVPAGGSQTYTITPNSGYMITEVSVDGLPQGAISTYTFNNVQADHTISSSFKPASTPGPDWVWSRDGWGDWEHTATWGGPVDGENSEYSPIIVNDPIKGIYGEHGTITHLNRGWIEASVWRTFTDPSGSGWNTITFNGAIGASSVPDGRWMTIDVNGQQVFGATNEQTPPGNTGEPFEVKASFPETQTATVKISQGQYPAWGVRFWMQFYSVTLSHENTVMMKTESVPVVIPDGEGLVTNGTAPQ